MKTIHLTFVLNVLLLMSLPLNCGPGSSAYGSYDGCSNIIAYHESNICDDSSIEIIIIPSKINQIEFALSEVEIGECVKVNLGTPPNDFIGWIFNDENKSWIINDCRE